MARPPKHPDEKASVVVTLRLTPAQGVRFDALLAHSRKLPGHDPEESRGDLLRWLLDRRYDQAVKYEMMRPVDPLEGERSEQQ